MNEKIEKILNDQLNYLLDNNLIDQNTKYAKHFKKVLDMLD